MLEFISKLHNSNQSCLFLIMIRLYFIGFFILMGAIVSNSLAAKIQCKTWYDFLQGMLETITFWNQVKFKDIIWLFFIYPLLLGLSAYSGNLLYQKIF